MTDWVPESVKRTHLMNGKKKKKEKKSQVHHCNWMIGDRNHREKKQLVVKGKKKQNTKKPTDAPLPPIFCHLLAKILVISTKKM